MSNDIPPWQRDLMGKLLSSGRAGIPYAIAQPNPFLPMASQPQPTVANPFRPAASQADKPYGQGPMRRDPVPSEGKQFSIEDLMKLTNARWTLRGDSTWLPPDPAPQPRRRPLPPDPAPEPPKGRFQNLDW